MKRQMNGRIKHKKWKQAITKAASYCHFDSKKERRDFVRHIAHAVRHVVIDTARAKKHRQKG